MSSDSNQCRKNESCLASNSSETSKGRAEAILESLDGQYFIIDICANLTNKKYSRDIDGVIERAKNAGVKKILVSGNSLQSCKDALRLTRLFPSYVYCTAGIHPNDANQWDEDVYSTLKVVLSNPECVAVGQCGLDFSKTVSEPSEQKDILEKQMKLAAELKKPILIFERDAHQDLVDILKNNVPCLPVTVIHSFSGNLQELQTYLSLGCYIGLTGSVWKDKSEDGLKNILENQLIPIDHLLVASDSPFMYPNARASQIPASIKEMLTEKSLSFLHRYCTFQRNEPCSLPVTIEMIAAFYKMRPDELALQTTYSALKIFGLN